MAKMALLIGVSEHIPGGLSPLPAARRDAEAVQRVLENPEIGGFEQTRLLINPDRQMMEEEIEILFSGRSKDDLALIYFSGHGITDDQGRLYFATHNTRKTSQHQLIKSTAVSAGFINDVMHDSRAKRQVVILDCCFSGAFAQGLNLKEDGSVDINNQLGGEGRAILTSSTSTTYSYERIDSDLSIYTYYLVEGIKTGAADSNNDGVITADELHEYCRRKTQENASAMKPQIYAVREGYKISIAKTPKTLIVEPKFKYRKQVERFAVRGEISIIGRNALDALRVQLGVSSEDAALIEEAFLKPFRERQEFLKKYEHVFIQATKQQYPLGSEAINELQYFREILGLSYDETSAIERKVVSQIEEEYRKQFQTDHILSPLKHILHLSDLHFGSIDNANKWYSQLADDLRYELDCSYLDILIISGDIANRSVPDEYTAAQQFLEALSKEFKLHAQQLVIVPGNHDLNWALSKKAYWLEWRDNYKGELREGKFIDLDDVLAVRNEADYQKRFTHFRNFYQAVKGEPYPLEYKCQAIIQHFEELNLLILGLNSAWQLDHHYKSRASIHSDALGNALNQIRQSQIYKDCFKVAVWHHPLTSSYEDRITDHGFMEQLAKAGFRLALHGHIHQAENNLYRYDLIAGGRKIDVISAGTFGAPTKELVPGYPWQYNLLKLEGNKMTVITRRREIPNGAWKPDARWLQGAGKDPLSRYEIEI